MSGPQHNGRRKKNVSPLTRSTAQLLRDTRKIIEVPIDEIRPTTRAHCEIGPRPCPWVGCRHHLYLDVNPDNGSIKFNFPELEPGDMSTSCSLDVTDDDGATLDEVGTYMNLSRERIRQVEVSVLKRLRKLIERAMKDETGQD